MFPQRRFTPPTGLAEEDGSEHTNCVRKDPADLSGRVQDCNAAVIGARRLGSRSWKRRSDAGPSGRRDRKKKQESGLINCFCSVLPFLTLGFVCEINIIFPVFNPLARS